MRSIVPVLVFAAASAVSFDAASQAYPARPVRFIVPYAPGGSVDTVARTLGDKLGEYWGQTVVVDNRPGGAANIGTDLAARSPADGYTLLLGTTANGVNLHILDKMPHNFIRDFAPISLLDTFYNVLVVNPAFQAKSVKELIALAKQKPGELTYGSSGVGSSNHFSGVLFEVLAGIQMQHVPYKAAPVALTDLLAGRIDTYFPGLVSSLPHIESGKLRALGVTGRKRSVSAPNVPTIAEAGLKGYELEPWHGLLAPTGTPRPVIDKVHADVVKALKVPAVRQKLMGAGIDNIIGSTPAELATFIRAETEKYGKLVKAAGMKKE
ncbi:MAG TPA: tripartite tricarboxylate transporter substrate binding protein [Burkholderiales bacterium]|nr:tripartite tricarboxylate transporter substrate binding protein [Burkholderiales bacterium]